MRRIDLVLVAVFSMLAVAEAWACEGRRTIVVIDRGQNASRSASEVLAAGLKQVIGSASSVGRIDLIGLGEGTSHREIGSDCLQAVPDVAAVSAQAEKDYQASLGPLEKGAALISGPSMVLRKPFEKRVEDARRARDAEVAKRSRLNKLAQEDSGMPPSKEAPHLLGALAVLVRERCRETECRILLFSSLIDSRTSYAMSPDLSRPADLAKDHAGYVATGFAPLHTPANLEVQVWGFGRMRDGNADLPPHSRGKLTEYWTTAIALTLKASVTFSSRLSPH